MSKFGEAESREETETRTQQQLTAHWEGTRYGQKHSGPIHLEYILSFCFKNIRESKLYELKLSSTYNITENMFRQLSIGTATAVTNYQDDFSAHVLIT